MSLTEYPFFHTVGNNTYRNIIGRNQPLLCTIKYQRNLSSGNISIPSKKILVVDDDGVNRKVLCSIIKHYNNKVGLDIQVEECSNGLESIRKVCSTHYDIIFMDINMPEMDGIEATKCIRDIYRTRNIEKRPSIIIASAYNKNDMGARAEVAGCDGYIMKPLKGDEVWNIIVNILNKKGGKCE